MKAYTFSMEKVLEWREGIEKNVMEKFAVFQNELNQEKLTLANLIKEYNMVKEKSLDCKKINELRQLQLYKADLEDRIEIQHQIIERKTKELEEVRQELITAQKDRKIMEKLKEKDYLNFQESLKAEEQKFIDEMAVLKFKKLEN
jgi:flagellar FliJ protein